MHRGGLSDVLRGNSERVSSTVHRSKKQWKARLMRLLFFLRKRPPMPIDHSIRIENS
jgi:hypothetical protein